MEYNVESISPVERKVTVTVPAEEVDAAILATTALYRRDADMKGFRKGKVPSSIVESKYKKQIIDEATTDMVNLHINEVLGELKLVPLSGLNVDSGELTKGEDFVYSFSFEVAPEFELPEYKGLKAKQERAVVDETEVDAVVDRIRGNLAELKDVDENRSPVDGEVVVISFAALNDEEFEGIKADNFQLELGQGQALPEFEEVVKKLTPGNAATEKITFPEDFINETLAGKTAEMRIHLTSIQEKTLPEIDDDLAQKAGGFENVAKMREAIVESYKKSREQLTKSAAQKKLLDDLVGTVDFPLPPSLVDKNLNYMLQDYVDKLERRGKSLASQDKTPESLREEMTPDAESLARKQVLLLAVAAKEDLDVQPGEVEAVVRQAAAESGQEFETLWQYHERTGSLFDIKDRLLADKAMELIYEAAEVEEVEPAEEEAKAEAE